jgi:hypothetical protein
MTEYTFSPGPDDGAPYRVTYPPPNMPERPDHAYDGCTTCQVWREAGGVLILSGARIMSGATMPDGSPVVVTLPPAMQPARAYGAGGKSWAELLDEYDTALISWREGDHDAAPRVKAMREQILAGLAFTPPPGPYHEAGKFTCAADGCPAEADTAAGYVGPWRQLVGLGWRRNSDGAWQCPMQHPMQHPTRVVCVYAPECRSSATVLDGHSYPSHEFPLSGWSHSPDGWTCPRSHSPGGLDEVTS